MHSTGPVQTSAGCLHPFAAAAHIPVVALPTGSAVSIPRRQTPCQENFSSAFMGIFPAFCEKEGGLFPFSSPVRSAPKRAALRGSGRPQFPCLSSKVIVPCGKICRRRAETPSKNAAVFAPHRGGPRLSSDGFCSAEVFQQIEGIRAETRIPSGTSGPVSRVLSFKTAIYLDALLPTRSSRLPGTAGPAYVSLHGVAPDRVYSDGRFHTPSGELLPHLSTFAAPWRGGSLFLLHFS